MAQNDQRLDHSFALNDVPLAGVEDFLVSFTPSRFIATLYPAARNTIKLSLRSRG